MYLDYNVLFLITVTEGSSSSSSTKSNSVVSSPSNLTRSRRSNFPRKDSTPPKKEAKQDRSSNADKIRILYEYERLMFYAKSPHSWALPADWDRICELSPAMVKNKVTMKQCKMLGAR